MNPFERLLWWLIAGFGCAMLVVAIGISRATEAFRDRDLNPGTGPGPTPEDRDEPL